MIGRLLPERQSCKVLDRKAGGTESPRFDLGEGDQVGEVTDIRTLAESRLHRGVRPSGLLRRQGSRLDPGEIQEIQAAAERGQPIQPDQALGMIEVIEALSRRAYVRFQQAADARDETAAVRLELIEAQDNLMMAGQQIQELDTRLATTRVEGQLGAEELESQLDAANKTIAELRELVKMHVETGNGAAVALADREEQIRRLRQECHDAVRQMGQARSEREGMKRLAEEANEELAKEITAREAADRRREEMSQAMSQVRELANSKDVDNALARGDSDRRLIGALADIRAIVNL